MAVDINLIVNCDDAVVFWRIGKRIENCWGVSIDREQRLAKGDVQRVTLENRTGFEDDQPKRGEHRPSTVWPFQRFWWADHSVNNGDTIRYRVTPMKWSEGKLKQSMAERSQWTPWTTLTGGGKDGYSSFFNRGLVISQFMARYLEELRVREGLHNRKEALAAFKESISQHELPIRQFLSGELRNQLLQLLAKTKGHVYAALYELDDAELTTALAKLGRRAHVVLANGSITAKEGEGTAAARKRDQNKEGRAALKAKEVEVFDRFISPGALGHNKFLVVAGGGAKPKASLVWTGSTNWTSTGLCTQINTGLIIENARVANEYLQQWGRLRDAASSFPAELIDANCEPKQVKTGKCSAEI